MVTTYHTDNGFFNDEEFIQEMLKSFHKIEFSGTESPHQNGVS